MTFETAAQRRRRTTYRALMCMLLAIVLSGCDAASNSSEHGSDDGSNGFLFPPAHILPGPRDLSSQIANNDVIVVGIIGDTIQETEIVHPTLATNPTLDPTAMAYDGDMINEPEPVTDIAVDVTDVLLSDGRFARGDQIILRINGHLSLEVPSELLSVTGEIEQGGSYLLFLNFNEGEPGATYSTYGGLHDQHRVDGSVVTYSNGKAVPFAVGSTPADYIDSVRREVATQHGESSIP